METRSVNKQGVAKMLNKVREARQFVAFEMDFYQMATYVEDGRNARRAEAFARVIIMIVIHKLLSLRCRVQGHKLVDRSYGGPESGYIAISCELCGQGWHNTLY
jgi:hypothetical protein